jgi:hypothetical protein
LFLQKKSPHDSLLDATSTNSSTISSGYSPLSLLGILECRQSHVLDSGKGGLTVRAPDSVGLLLDDLGDKFSTGCLDGDTAAGFGGVMPSYEGCSLIGHDLTILRETAKIREGNG